MAQFVRSGTRNGKSSIVEQIDLAMPTDALGMRTLMEIVPAKLSPRPEGSGGLQAIPVAPGAVRWFRISFPPSSVHAMDEMHHTDTMDCLTIVAGSTELLLDDGPHQLEVGDCVIVAGVDHGWRTGENGCVMSSMIFGTPPP